MYEGILWGYGVSPIPGMAPAQPIFYIKYIAGSVLGAFFVKFQFPVLIFLTSAVKSA